MDALHTPLNDRLFAAVLKLENIEECYKFFEDICTVKEIGDIAQRLKVAEMLLSENSYHEISAQTGASTATISRVNRCLLYGGGGYKTIITRLDTEENI